MRTESSREAAGGAAREVLCGGFDLAFENERVIVQRWPGERRLAHGISEAVVQGLLEAPRLVSQALHLKAPRRPYERVEVALAEGASTSGEALPVGSGCIRLSLGESARPEEGTRIARHEALHLLLASCMRGGERWNDPELAFADWIVRGLESLGTQVPRFSAPLPGILKTVPISRLEVQARLRRLSTDPDEAKDYFGEPLLAELRRMGDDGALEQRRLWLVEAALGTHYLEAAGRLDAAELRPLLLDDWLAEYEQYARAVANPPSGTGNLWRLSDAGWSREALVRLSVAAQALQCDDHCAFGKERAFADPLVWKQRGRIRVPLVRTQPRLVPAPIHGFRAALRAIGTPEAEALLEQAAGGGAHLFEARALWPRVLSRLLAVELAAKDAEPGPSLPSVQVVDSGEGGAAFRAFSEAAAALRALLGERARWVPRVLEPRPIATVLEAPLPIASTLLVHGIPLSAEHSPALLAARRLAAQVPVRGALFFGSLGGGRAHELWPDLDEPLDPRYREETWVASEKLPARLEELPALADEATREGRLTSPLSHLLAMMGVGLEECLYPRG